MQKRTQRVDVLSDLSSARYALLRTFRRDGTSVDTPIWFGVQADSVVFRTKIGPKTKRLAARPDVELTACDYRGRVRGDGRTFAGRATILSGVEAAEANRALHRRYGWQWNVVPLIKIPGVTNVHHCLSLWEKLRRARDRNVWPDSAIVRIDFA
jgi:PPOX class probable F420-dependent enzyme